MIIYYDKNTGKIYGAIMGRVHNEFELKENLIQPQGVDLNNVRRLVISPEKTKELEYYLLGKEMRVIECEVILDEDPENFIVRKRLQPSKAKPDAVDTLVIDLKKPLKEIEADYSTTTKRWLKSVENEHMSFREVPFSEIGIVRDVIEELEELKDIKLAKHLLTVRAAFLDGLRRAYVVEGAKKEPLAVALITAVGGKFVYTLGGVTLKGRSTHAGDFLVHNLIKDAKELGFDKYDLGGIYADWASEDKKKINIFKERWGGKRTKLI